LFVSLASCADSWRSACPEAIHVFPEEYQNKNKGLIRHISDEFDVAFRNQLRQLAV